MIAVDANILVHAHRADSEWHVVAAEALRKLASTPWALPWPCVSEFFCAVTKKPGVYRTPSTNAQALAQLEFWLSIPTVRLLAETAIAWPTLRELLSSSKIIGGTVHDARIAALCLQHGVETLWTADRDFSRFPLRVVNPLIAERANEPRARYGVSAAAKQKTAARPRAR